MGISAVTKSMINALRWSQTREAAALEARQSRLKRIFETLQAKGQPELYRRDPMAGELYQGGFTPEAQAKGYLPYEPAGLYFAKDPIDLPYLIPGRTRPATREEAIKALSPRDLEYYAPNITAVPFPSGRHKTFSPKEWEEYIKPFKGDSKALTQALKKDYDWVTFPDLAVGSPNAYQTVQLNPNKSVARITPVYDKRGWEKYRVLGITAVLGSGMAALELGKPEEADAGVVTEAVKGTAKALRAQTRLKKSYENLKKMGQPELYRRHVPGEELYRTGFDVRAQARGYHSEEPAGLYFAKDPVDLPYLLKGRRRPESREEAAKALSPEELKYSEPNITAVPLLWGRHKTFSPEEWREYTKPFMHREPAAITEALKKDYDWVTFPDTSVGSPYAYQTVQLNPNRSLARITEPWRDPNWERYRILGAAGALGGSMALTELKEPKEAEAGVLTEVGKAAAKKLGPLTRSSTADALKGRTIQAFGENAIIKDVYKGQGGNRFVELQDGRILRTDKDDLQRLVKMQGAAEYYRRALDLGHEQLYDAAMKAYRRQLQRTPPVFTPSAHRGIANKKILENLAEMVLMDQGTVQSAEYVVVKDLQTKGLFPILKPYAEVLERSGLVQTDKQLTNQMRNLIHGKTKKE